MTTGTTSEGLKESGKKETGIKNVKGYHNGRSVNNTCAGARGL